MNTANRPPQETINLFRAAAELQEKLPYESVTSLTTDAERLFANDADFYESLTAAVLQTPQPAESKTAIGLIVGNGYIESILPELPVDAVTLVDNEPDVHAWQRFSGRLLLQSDGVVSYRKGVQADASAFGQDLNRIAEKNSWARINRYHYEQKPWDYPVPILQNINLHSIDGYHFLADEDRFKRCQEAYARTPLTYATADISDSEKMGRIGQSIREANGEITYMNLTNVVEYIISEKRWEGYQQALGALPLHDNVFIAYSSCTVMRNDEYAGSTTPPPALWTQGLQSYLDFCKATPHPMFGSYRS